MAKVTSGSFNTTAYSNRYLTFSWSCTQDIAKNQSTISWSLKGAGSASGYYKAAPFTVVIAGETVYSSETRIELYNGTTVASGTKTITHNTNGTKSFTASVKAAIYSYAENVSGSQTWDLKDIPRGATITNAPNFTDEQNATITYSNPLGNGVGDLLAGISFDRSTTPVSYRSISKTGTSYTFNFTEAERTALRNNCKDANSTTVYFYLRTVINGTNYHSSIAKTLTIVNATPTFTATIKDVGTGSTVLTGDANKMIKGFNYMSASIAATALKGASIKSYKITNGGKTVNAASGSFTNTEDNKFVVTVTDSRGNSVSNTITKTMINYTKLTAAAEMKISLDETDGTKANITVNMNGNYFNGSFGAKSNSLRYDIKVTQVETGASYTNYETIPTSDMSGGKYNHTYTETQLPYQNSWKIELKIYDAVTSITIPVKILKAQPIFDWGEEDFNFNVPVAAMGYNLLGAAKALTETYTLTTTVTKGSNYSSATVSNAVLIGNNLRCNFKVTRSSAYTGNTTNEIVCSFTIKHDGKIKSLYTNDFGNGSAGATASFYISNQQRTDTDVTFDVYLAATGTASTDFTCYFTLPVSLNLDAYI